MKILVLGNGFDLDHNLPTSYMDFLHFCNYVLEMDNPESKAIEKLKPVQVQYAEVLKTSEPVKNTFSILIKNNPFLRYFNAKAEMQGENWIDFEREINNIVNEFKAIEFKLKQSNQNSCRINSNHKVHRILQDLGLDLDSESWDEACLSLIHQKLCCSLKTFSTALEYYIAVFVNATPLEGVSPDIIDFDADKVLTFNYSNTYERLYGGVRWNESIDHIHGLAVGTLDDEPNIILGITTRKEDLQNYYVEFEKYFQRITKKTGNEYKKWLHQRKGINEKIEIMFFGHSLDAMDSDIIRDLICNNSAIKIYYNNEQSHQQIVTNLIEIIRKDNLIKFVSGDSPKIEFIKQREHRVDNTAGREITRDIRRLYRLYMLTNGEITELLSKLKTKIEEKDLAYFYSQKKAISLFEALKYHKIDSAELGVFFEICEQLDFEKMKNGKVRYYFEEEWYDNTPWGIDEECDEETSILVSMVNQSNQKRLQQAESSNPYAKILLMESSEEIKEALVEIFNEDTPDDAYWQQLEDLFVLMYKDRVFEEALQLIEMEQLPLSVSSKFKHFKNAYLGHCFNRDFAEQMA